MWYINTVILIQIDQDIRPRKCNRYYETPCIYCMKAHWCTRGLKLDLRSGSQRHRHFVGFFNVPVQAPTFYTVIPRSRHLVAFFDTLGIREHILDLTPGSSRGGGGYLIIKWKYKNIFTLHSPTPPRPSRRKWWKMWLNTCNTTHCNNY